LTGLLPVRIIARMAQHISDSAPTMGLRHLALNVTDVERSKSFYEQVFGMRVVWQPDADNVYLSSGSDNLALHRASSRPDGAAQRLDHFGFVMVSVAAVNDFYEKVTAARHASILKEPKLHRDGSFSFYLNDPDGNVIQVLYEPNISKKD